MFNVDDVFDLADFVPPEEIMLNLFRGRFDGILVQSLIPNAESPYPLIVSRGSASLMHWRGSADGQLDSAYVRVDVFARGLDADDDAAWISEAVRKTIADVARRQEPIPTRKGNVYLSRPRLLIRGRREADWATAAGPVQYADLPADVVRYESTFRMFFRYQ